MFLGTQSFSYVEFEKSSLIYIYANMFDLICKNDVFGLVKGGALGPHRFWDPCGQTQYSISEFRNLRDASAQGLLSILITWSLICHYTRNIEVIIFRKSVSTTFLKHVLRTVGGAVVHPSLNLDFLKRTRTYIYIYIYMYIYVCMYKCVHIYIYI